MAKHLNGFRRNVRFTCRLELVTSELCWKSHISARPNTHTYSYLGTLHSRELQQCLNAVCNHLRLEYVDRILRRALEQVLVALVANSALLSVSLLVLCSIALTTVAPRACSSLSLMASVPA